MFHTVLKNSLILCGLSILLTKPCVQADEVARLKNDGDTVAEPARKTPVTHRADVVVVGAAEGGLGGCMAAIAAAREGASVLLIVEGGRIEFHVPIALGYVVGIKGWKPDVHEGLFRDFAETLARTGEYHAYPLTPEETLERGEVLIRRHDVAAAGVLTMLEKAGVKMLFHAKVVDTVVNDGKLQAVIIESPQGRHAVAGIAFVDSTGLGDVAAEAGAPMLREEAYMSLQAQIGRVDEAKYRRWVEADDEPLDDSYREWLVSLVGPLDEQHHPWDQWWPEYLGDRMPPAVTRKAREAQQNGDLTIIHRRGDAGVCGIVEGVKAINDFALPRTYITGIDPLNVDDVSWAETTSRLALMEFQRFLKKYIPGFEDCVLERLADRVSLRGGRYIQIDQQLTREEIDGGARNADCIFIFSRNDGKIFEVPYRALAPKNVEGLLVVGKATAGGVAMRTAHGILLQGQAAGVAAAMAVKEGIAPRDIDIDALQTTLKADGVEIPYP